ncbi:MAG: hypothetical protein P0Y62_15440 [Candidatus Chryseobacterium colombiense]|nr:hypothetical protein [Chryseobacterium sp.]WEK69230.1 MAG: hypothetical protein P0Y62_15440 [Chryseobacterium sp.]
MRTILNILLFAFLMFIFNCKPCKESSVSVTEKLIGGEKHLKIPRKISDSMKKGFVNESNKILTTNNIIFKNKYELSLANLAKMLWTPEVDEEKYDEFRIYFTYDNGILSNYPDLVTYDKSICLIYSRELDKREEKKYYAAFSVKSPIEIRLGDFDKLRENYKTIVKYALRSRIDSAKNTNYITIPRDQLSAYYAKITLYNDNNVDKISHVNVCLAEALDYNGFPATKGLDYLKKKNYNPNQLTLIFDAVTTGGNDVEYLSSYDMNSLCPNQCP